MSSLRLPRPPRLLRLAPSALLAITAIAGASVVVEVPLEEMVSGSDAIVVASVMDTGSRMEPRGGRLQPVTRTRVRVLRWLAGPGGRHLVVATPGGRHPRGERRVVGAPTFRPGEQVLLFLRREAEAYVPYGLSLGVYRIERGRGSTPARVARRTDGLLLARRRGGELVMGDGADAEPVPLADFLARIEALLAPEARP